MVVEREIIFTSGERQLRCFYVMPEAPGARPGVVVIHEAYGLNDNIRKISRRPAAEGYAALAVDLFTDRSKAVCMARFFGASMLGRESPGVRDLRRALDYLAGQPGIDGERIGAIGFCMGGGYAIAWARSDDRLKAIAPFYGTNPRPVEAIRRMCPVVGSYPGSDFTAKAGRRLDAHLSRLGVPHDIKIYPGAKHSFFNERSRAHDAGASADAWERTLAFFATRLGPRKPAS
jgi:carboxymethylenebutenolidase